MAVRPATATSAHVLAIDRSIGISAILVPTRIDDVCMEGNEDTPAQFQERCGRLALKLHYGEFGVGDPGDDAAVKLVDKVTVGVR